LNDLRPRLCSWPKECRRTAQHHMRPACAAALPHQPATQRFAASPAPAQQELGSAPSSQVRCRSSPAAATERRSCQLNLHSKESINVANLRVNQWSQINENTVEPSLAAQDINPVTYTLDLIFTPHARFVPGSVQLIRPVRVLSLAVAHSTARPNRQPLAKEHFILIRQMAAPLQCVDHFRLIS